MLTFVLLTALAMHGIGHVLFVGPAIGLADWGSGHSWLLTNLLGDGLARTIAGAIWVSAGALFLLGVAGFVRNDDWWRAATIAGAAISLIGIVVYFDGIKQPSGVAALAFNVLVLGALVVARWPSTGAFNS